MAQATLNPRQLAFAREYCVDRNQTQAAVRAGYSEKTANQQASRLFANANIQRVIAELIRESEDTTIVTRNKALADLYLIAGMGIKGNQLSAAIGAYKLIAQICGWLIERHEIENITAIDIQWQATPGADQ